MKELIIATRASDLALWQAYHIEKKIKKISPDTKVIINKIVSRGDKILDKPLALIGGKGHFTKELEDEMLANNAHMAVHSLKDVPTYMPEGLELVAVTKRKNQKDIFLSHKYKSLKALPEGAIVGTTSLRRRMQLLRIRPDLNIKDLRGNVNTRLRKLKEGQYDAIILAYIGLKRLKLLANIPYTKKLPLLKMIPPMGQAALGIQIVSSNNDIRKIAQQLNHQDTYVATMVERDFVAHIEAGCSSPVACNATLDGDVVTLKAMIGYPDGTNCLTKTLSALVSKCDKLGKTLASDFLADGAKEILDNASKIAFKEQMPQRI